VDAAHGRGPREADAVAVAIGAVRLRGTDAPWGITPRGGHDNTHLNIRVRRRGDTRLGTVSSFSQLGGRLTIAARDKGETSRPPDARRAPRGTGGGRTVQGGARRDGQQRQVAVPRGPERPVGAHGAIGRGRASLPAAGLWALRRRKVGWRGPSWGAGGGAVHWQDPQRALAL